MAHEKGAARQQDRELRVGENDGILVDETTRRDAAAEDSCLVDFEPLPPLSLKGHDGAFAAFRPSRRTADESGRRGWRAAANTRRDERSRLRAKLDSLMYD